MGTIWIIYFILTCQSAWLVLSRASGQCFLALKVAEQVRFVCVCVSSLHQDKSKSRCIFPAVLLTSEVPGNL